MYTLILDSSTKVLYCALVKDEIVLNERYLPGQNDHAKNINIVIQELLNEAHIEALQLDKVVCGHGPGSYTGVRMAVTVSKMLCSLSQIKLYEISSLFLMSSKYETKTIAMIDARRGNVFSAVYENYNLVKDEGLRNKEELMSEVSDYAQIVTESKFSVDPLVVIKCAKPVENPFSFAPNYLRETEAQRNLHA